MTADGFAMAMSLAAWKEKVYKGWSSIKINYVKNNDRVEQKVGNFFEVEAGIALGSLSPDDVSVEIYNGMVDGEESFASGQPIPEGPPSRSAMPAPRGSIASAAAFRMRILPARSAITTACGIALAAKAISWFRFGCM